MLTLFAKLRRDRKAATAVEYGLVAALICITAMIGIIALGAASKDTWGNIHTKVKAASGG